MKKTIIIAIMLLTVLTGCGSAQLPELDQGSISEAFLFEARAEREPTPIVAAAVQEQIVAWYEQSTKAKELNETLPGDYFKDNRAYNIVVVKLGEEERFVFYAFYPREKDGRIYFEHFLGEGPESVRSSYTTHSHELYNFIVGLRALADDQIVTEAMIVQLVNEIETGSSN